MKTITKEHFSEETQKVASFHNEGAYHGATQFRDVPIPEFEEEEMRPTTLISGTSPFEDFEASFSNDWTTPDELGIPSQEEIKTDGVTFAWASLQVALQEAGPLTRKVLQVMEKNLAGNKKFVYVDSKIQFFKKGDVPVDSRLWHVDGSISCRDIRATRLGHSLLHDLKARQECKVSSPQYMAYQSSSHCATQWQAQPFKIILPACVPSFDYFDKVVNQQSGLRTFSQGAGTIIKFDGFDIHRAVSAKSDGWRLWIRCTETNKEIHIPESVANNYGIVYRDTL
jgi:hypothetical protein